jgi:hypothetical protein
MAKTTGHVLKASDVKLEGQLYLELANTQGKPPKDKNTILPAPQIRIVENQQEFAVIEVTCWCGRKIHLKCEYNGSAASA